MRKAEIEQIGGIVQAIVNKELQPVRDMALSTHQTLHGTKENPETGLVYEFGSMKKKVWRLTAITNFISASGGYIVSLLTKGKL